MKCYLVAGRRTRSACSPPDRISLRRFLTPPKDHGREIRAYVRDPDGHLIEVGQTTGLLD